MTPQQAYATVQQTLLSIVMEAMTFEEIDANLRQNGYHREADTLDRLIQDVGLELKRAMDAPAPGDATAGPKTAEINIFYNPVTAERLLATFESTTALIQEDTLRAVLIGLTEDFREGEAAYTAAQAIIRDDENPSPVANHKGKAPIPSP